MGSIGIVTKYLKNGENSNNKLMKIFVDYDTMGSGYKIRQEARGGDEGPPAEKEGGIRKYGIQSQLRRSESDL